MPVIPSLLNELSLADTVASVEEAHFFGNRPSAASAKSVLDWLVDRQKTGKGYGPMCAPTVKDLSEGAKLFTGERLGPGAQTKHVLGEEAYRSTILLSQWTHTPLMPIAEVMSAGMNLNLDREFNGRFCCGPCSISVWRALAIGGYKLNEERLIMAMRFLKTKRDSSGRWGSLPFFYTLLALSEIENDLAKSERDFAKSTCEQQLRRRTTLVEPFATRRIAILERILSRD